MSFRFRALGRATLERAVVAAMIFAAIGCAVGIAPARAQMLDAARPEAMVSIFAKTEHVGATRAKTAHVGSSSARALVAAAAARNGVPVHLAFGVIRVESRFDCHARRTGNGEVGIGQINPRTAASVGVVGIHDCTRNVEASMRYLRLAIDRGGAGCAGVALYQTGIYARPRCTSYGRRVMHFAHHGA